MRFLLFFCVLLGPLGAEPVALPADLLKNLEAQGHELRAHDELKKDDFQTLFSAGVLENMFEHLKKVESATESVFVNKSGETVTLVRLQMSEALAEEDFRELASIESLTLERSLEKLKMAQFFVETEEPKDAVKLGPNYSDQFVYSLRKVGTETPLQIRRARHYGPKHLVIMTAAKGKTDAETLAKWLLLLPETQADKPDSAAESQ